MFRIQSQTTSRTRQSGFSLMEMVVVVLVLAIVVRISMPRSAPTNEYSIDVAANDVINAIRFAQSEAIRTGQYRTVGLMSTQGQVKVYKLDINAAPPVEDTSDPVMHPLEKRPYLLDINDTSLTAGVQMTNTPFTFEDGATRNDLSFTPDGLPVRVTGSGPANVVLLQNTVTITLSYGTARRIIGISPVTGRVTVS